MNFYTTRHQYYCGVDLHARMLYVCILDRDGKVLLHRPIPAEPERFLALLEPYGKDIVVGAECMFCWYWLADACEDNEIPFVLGHALYMKAIHGGKAKNDRIDSKKIAHLLLGCNWPQAYVYPRAMRAMRDLLRRRMYFVRHRAEMVSHIRNTASQYNLPAITGHLDRRGRWEEVCEHFPEGPVRETVTADLATVEHLSGLIAHVEWYIEKATREVNYRELSLLRSIHGIGRVLALTIVHEICAVEETRVGTCSAPPPIPAPTGRAGHGDACAQPCGPELVPIEWDGMRARENFSDAGHKAPQSLQLRRRNRGRSD